MNAGAIGQPEEFNFRRVRVERGNGTPGKAPGEKPVRKISGTIAAQAIDSAGGGGGDCADGVLQLR